MKLSPFLISTWVFCAGASALEQPVEGIRHDIDGSRPPKHFYEDPTHIHYDARFIKKPLEDAEQRDVIRFLVQTYLSTCRDLGIVTWLMHGSLLGWWWGKKIMPWDLDADVSVTEQSMFFLAHNYNMTTYQYRYDNGNDESDTYENRTLLLEVNPSYVVRGPTDRMNVIDARWIDTSSGLFIDITAARYHPRHPQGEGMLFDKNFHEYRDTYLYPLLDSTFEGVPVKIPYGYKQMLESEYGKKALRKTEYHNHYFDTEKMQWLEVTEKMRWDD